MFGKIAAGFSAAKIGEMLISLGKESVQLASDLEEVQNVVDVTFGSAGASKIDAWAKNAGSQFGLTETQAKKFTSTLGAMMKSAGLSGSEITDMSTDLAGLAADMASFYNLDFDTAFQKIRSGISGETEPLKQLGINMSVANLNAFALEKGLNKTFDQMSQSEQTMLRYEYLMSATADAQGDFARTSDGLANSTRTLQTEITTLKTKLGDVLTPAVKELLGYVNQFFPKEVGHQRTLMDDINDVDIDKDTKLKEIGIVADQARTLIGYLDEIGDNKSAPTTVKNLAKGANTLNNSAKDNWESLEDSLSGMDDLKTLFSDQSTAENTVKGIATGANKLNGSTKANWTSLLTSLQGIDGLENLFTDSETAIGTVEDLAAALSGESVTTSKAQAWDVFLGALSSNAEAIADITGESVEDTQAWLSGMAEEAKKISPTDAAAWDRLLTTFSNKLGFDLKEGIPTYVQDIAKGANTLRSTSPTHWESVMKSLTQIDGLQNLFGDSETATGTISDLASALSGNGITTNKAQAWDTFLGALADNAEAVSALTGKSVEETKKWLEGMAAEAHNLSPEDAAAWDTLMSALVTGLGMSGTAEGQEFLSLLTQNFLALGNESDEAVKGMQALGYLTEDIEAKQADWLATCRELVRVIPGLSDIIDTNTGEIKGGIPALKAYVDEWERMSKYETEVAALREKQRIFNENNDLDTLESNVRFKRAALNARVGEGNLAYTAGSSVKLDDNGNIVYDSNGNPVIEYQYGNFVNDIAHEVRFRIRNGKNFSADAIINDMFGNQYGDIHHQQSRAWYLGLDDKSKAAIREYTEAVIAYEDAAYYLPLINERIEKDVEEIGEAYGVTEKEIEAAAAAAEDAAASMSLLERAANADADAIEDISTAVDTALEALQELDEYVASVRADTASSVNSTLSGFSGIETAAEKYARQAAEAYQKYKDEFGEDAKNQDVWAETIWDGGEQVTLVSMNDALDSQLKFMKEYNENLEKARAAGVSEDILAFLSDGSEESAMYLHAIAEAIDHEDWTGIQKLNKQWAEVQAGKEDFVDVLTEQKLAADDSFDAMVAKAQEAAKGLDVSGDAGQSIRNNMEAIRTNLADSIPGIEEEINTIVDLMNRLEGWNIHLDLTTDTGEGEAETDGSFATGLDYVPFDGFLAQLHEGEGILTAEENRVWQQFITGGRGVDYDQLGGVMRENIKAGGNVYLEGRVVGRVMSDIQGDQYRTLQRSGWQQ